MRVLVTGGTGFIGRHVADQLTRDGHQPVRFDRRRGLGEAAVSLGDIRDAEAVQQAVQYVEAVIHLAGVLGTQETIDHPRTSAEVNVLGTLNVLEACRTHAVPMVNIGVGNYWMTNTYAITKNAAESLCRMFAAELDVAVSTVRGMNAYGPGQEAAVPYGPSKVRKIIPAFVSRALAGTPIEVYGDGSQIMDMIYVTDLADVVCRTLYETAQFGALGRVVEAGTGRSTTVLQIAEIARDVVAAATGQEPVEIKYLPMRPGEPAHAEVLADTTSLAAVGADPKVFLALKNGIELTVEWFRKYPR